MKQCILYYSLLFITACGVKGTISEKTSTQTAEINQSPTQLNDSIMSDEKVIKDDEEWRSMLTPLQFQVTRKAATEHPFTGKFYKHKEKGIYTCVCCKTPLFESDTKYESGCGWPSFFDVFNSDKVTIKDDFSHGMVRKEVLCKKCDAHLGHVFEDGPPPTGLRYCINSASLDFMSISKE